jgi:hypothetical protein
MNWQLIVRLSLFGLVMGVATVYVIPSNVEPFVWLPVFGFCAYAIATSGSGRLFVHGLALGVANSVWITTAHILLFDAYVATHPAEAEMMTSMPLPDSPRLMMAITGPVIGVVSGVVIGLLALGTGKLVGGSQH